MSQQDTICAIATAQGGAIGVIRISGPQAIAATTSIFQPVSGKSLNQYDAYKQIFGKIYSPEGEIIDEVLVSLFRAPHSYTGEDSVEISCHGSSYILQKVIHLLIANGCRLAEPGEYTQRAFLNGKMDLSQAEAVADLIASLMELELDFSDHEELEFADRSELTQIANDIEKTVSRLANSFSVGNAIKNGVPVAIIGETNAGKSTLLNALLNEEKAIVSDIHGTTRDVIEDTINLRGITFRFIDTAGIRQTTDVVESIGIERTYQKMEQANIILWMIDGTSQADFEELKTEILPYCEEKQLIILFNKADKLTPEIRQILSQSFSDIKAPKLFLSAKTRDSLDELETLLVKTAALPEVSQNDVIVTNIRHYEALSRALDSIHRVQDGLQMQLSGDFVSQDLRECLYHLAEIVGGEIGVEEVLGNIFKHFCVGK